MVRIAMIAVVLLLLLIGGAGGGLYFFAAKLPPQTTAWIPGGLRPMLKLPPLPAPPPPPEVPAFYDLPDMLAELPVRGRQNRLVRLAVALRLGGQEDANAVQGALPQIRDAFQVYLRDNRLGDLENPDSLERCRHAMLARIAQLVRPAKIEDVLFREVAVQ